MELTSAGVFRRYEEIRSRLPQMAAAGQMHAASNLAEIASMFDVFFLDAFGVLNVGDTVIPGAPEAIAALKAAGKSAYVVTNAATQDLASLMQKYHRMGFDFALDEIVSSRSVMAASLGQQPGIKQWAAIVPEGASLAQLPPHVLTLETNPDGFWRADGYLFLSSKRWTGELQQRLVERLVASPCPVLVGNPDLVAPRETGLSREPGFYAHDILDRADCPVAFFGKPFGNAFEATKAAASLKRGLVVNERIAMVGDTLHTDILGGSSAGVKTVLVTDHGVLKGENALAYIDKSGIRPDFIIGSIVANR